MLTLDPASLIMCSPEDAQRHDARHVLDQPAKTPPPPASQLHTLAKPLPTSVPDRPLPERAAAVPAPPPIHDLLDGTPHALEIDAGTMVLGPDGIARVRVREGFWVRRADVTTFLDWLDTLCPAGAPILIDKRRPYALDFSAQQAIVERMRAPAAALLIPTLDKLPLAEYSRETYLRHITTRIFRSEAHALRWLGTFLGDGPFLPAHDLIHLPAPLDLDG